MKTYKTAVSLTSLIIAVGACLGARDAGAAIQPRNLVQNAVGPCQAALPAFEGRIRKRPLALQNEGTSSAFVSCAFSSLTPGSGVNGFISKVVVYAASNDGAAHLISCTGVSGYNGGTNQYIPKSRQVLANGQQAELIWYAFEFSGSPGVFPSAIFSVSCNLEPGVGLNDTQILFDEDVGA